MTADSSSLVYNCRVVYPSAQIQQVL